ncbi:MAG: ATPase domain-containing protein, partial [Candidatus Aenigmatarchaeota archaeon]
INYVKKVDAKRFVLDSLSIATMGWKVGEMDLTKIRAEVFGFMKSLKSLDVTSLLITEVPETETKALSRFGFEEFLADGVIILHYLEYAAGGTPRSLIIRKMRRTNHSTDIFPIEITNQGMKLGKAAYGIKV